MFVEVRITAALSHTSNHILNKHGSRENLGRWFSNLTREVGGYDRSTQHVKEIRQTAVLTREEGAMI